MKNAIFSRRTMLEAACAMAAAGGVRSAAAAEKTGLPATNEDAVRRYYAAWEKKDWPPMDQLLTDNFTFSSAAGDDHIDKSVFKKKCWESQVQFIDRFDLRHVVGHGNEAFVLYDCLTKSGKTFRNVEFIRLRDGKLEALECYFGAQSSFPSAVSGKG